MMLIHSLLVNRNYDALGRPVSVYGRRRQPALRRAQWQSGHWEECYDYVTSGNWHMRAILPWRRGNRSVFSVSTRLAAPRRQ